MTRTLASLVVSLRWLVVVAWLAGAVAATLWLPSLQQAESTSLGDLVPEDSEAARTAARASELFSVPVLAQTAVVQRDPAGLADEAVERLARRALESREGDGLVSFALPVANTGGLAPGAREDGTTAVTYLFFEPGTSIGEEATAARAWARENAGRPEDALVGVTGSSPARLAEWREIESALPWVTLATVAVVFAILALTYRAVGAPLLVLGAAGVAYLVAVRVAPAVGEAAGVAIPSDLEPVLVVLLLGIVTDYAVFFLSGMRERLLAGDRPRDAAVAATSRFLPIVVTAGLIVAAGTAVLAVGRVEFFRALAPGLALTVLVSLAVSITLVPALLALLGRALFWPSLRTPPPRRETAPVRVRRVDSWSESLAEFAASRPVALVVLAVAVGLVALASRGLAGTDLGVTTVESLPADREERRAAEAAGEGFAPGILAPTALVLEGEEPLEDEALSSVQDRLAEQPGVAGVLGPADEAAGEVDGLVRSETAEAARFLLVLEDEPQGARAIATFERLREELPVILSESGLGRAAAGFTGETALAAETVATVTGDVARIAAAAFAVNFLLLVLFLRSLVAPLYLLAASALAFAATLGLTTVVFEDALGHGELTYYVPFAVAVLLLSLGSDYNVFLVGRIWQEARRTSLRDAVALAAPSASGTIAVAGVALALSFAALAIVDLRPFREFAFATAVGVLLDAFVIRSVVVPALVSVFGELSWWPARRRPTGDAPDDAGPRSPTRP